MPAPLRCVHATSSANIFVQLARRTTPATNAAAPILSVLVPRWKPATTTATAPAGFGASRKYSSKALLQRGLSQQRYIRRTVQQQTRAFTASATRRQTRCAWNPKKDEDGQEMKLEITDRAGKRLSDIMKKDNNPNLALRIQVESGGCHGFQYLMSLITLPESGEGSEDWSKAVGEDDTVFQYLPADADLSGASFEGPKVVIDEPSLDLLKGSKVDFTMELIGSQFKITDNPYASSSCGCGTSFDIKI